MQAGFPVYWGNCLYECWGPRFLYLLSLWNRPKFLLEACEYIPSFQCNYIFDTEPQFCNKLFLRIGLGSHLCLKEGDHQEITPPFPIRIFTSFGKPSRWNIGGSMFSEIRPVFSGRLIEACGFKRINL